jgi:hypothetical protein
MALKPLTPVINSHPPLPGAPLAPIKGRGAPPAIIAPHLALNRSLPSPQLLLTERHRLPILHHRRPASTAPPELRCDPSRVPLTPLSVLHPRRRALVHRSGRRPSSGERAAVPSVRTGIGPRWIEHTRPVHGDMDPVHGFIRWKIICYLDYSKILQRGPWTFVKSTHGPDFVDFALRPLGFSEINQRSVNFQLGLKFKKIFKKGPQLQKNPQK